MKSFQLVCMPVYARFLLPLSYIFVIEPFRLVKSSAGLWLCANFFKELIIYHWLNWFYIQYDFNQIFIGTMAIASNAHSAYIALIVLFLSSFLVHATL